MSLTCYHPEEDSDDSDAGVTIPPLNEENYNVWSSHTSQALISLNLWDLISSSGTIDTAETSYTETKQESARKRQACAMIRLAVGRESTFHYICSLEGKTPKELWETIREAVRSRFDPWDLRGRLLSTRLESFAGVEEYICKIDNLIDQLEFVKSKHEKWEMPNDERTFWYRQGLPESWNEFVLSLLCTNIGLTEDHEDNIMFSRDALRRKLLDYGEILREKKARNPNKRCSKCKQSGHVQRDCPE